MLVLGIKFGDQVQIGDSVIVIEKGKGNRLKLCVEAPRDVNVRRGELLDKPREAA